MARLTRHTQEHDALQNGLFFFLQCFIFQNVMFFLFHVFSPFSAAMGFRVGAFAPGFILSTALSAIWLVSQVWRKDVCEVAATLAAEQAGHREALDERPRLEAKRFLPPGRLLTPNSTEGMTCRAPRCQGQDERRCVSRGGSFAVQSGVRTRRTQVDRLEVVTLRSVEKTPTHLGE